MLLSLTLDKLMAYIRNKDTTPKICLILALFWGLNDLHTT